MRLFEFHFMLTKQSFRLQLWSLVWFQVRATSCHLTSSKLAWKSTSKCTWMCWRVLWSPGAIRWLVADPGCGSRIRRWPTSPKRPRLGFRRSATTLYPSLTVPPLLPYFDLNLLDYFVWCHTRYHNCNRYKKKFVQKWFTSVYDIYSAWQWCVDSSPI